MSLLRARRVAGVARERVEVLPDGRHLVAVPDLVAQAEEDVLDLAARLGQQVQPAADDRRAGDRDVEGVAGERRFQLEALELGATGVECLLEPAADAVQQHPRLAVAHAAERLGDVGLAAEVAHARVFELGRRRRSRYRGERCCFMCLPIRLVRRHGGETIQGSLLRFAGRDEDCPGAAEGR